MKLLALDTASGQCSAALLANGLLISRTARTAREHAQLLLPMVDAVLAEGGLSLRSLDGIAFGCGPGSFTGLRIAAAVTQGLAAGADLPVLPVSDLRALAEGARTASVSAGLPTGGCLLACMDARMGELYWGVFDEHGPPVGMARSSERLSTPAGLIEALPAVLPPGVLLKSAAGMGLSAYPSLAAAIGLDPSRCHPQAEPHAAEIAQLAASDLASGAAWLDAALAQPVYLRDKVVQAPL
jgi:tRNA threonylcarbamoyladenosine biosynthesis protein TsaB